MIMTTGRAPAIGAPGRSANRLQVANDLADGLISDETAEKIYAYKPPQSGGMSGLGLHEAAGAFDENWDAGLPLKAGLGAVAAGGRAGGRAGRRRGLKLPLATIWPDGNFSHDQRQALRRGRVRKATVPARSRST